MGTDGAAGRRIVLPSGTPQAHTVARILALSGWRAVSGPAQEGDFRGLWRAAPSAPGEVGLYPLHLGTPDRTAGLSLDPGADGRLGPTLANRLASDPLDDTALLDRARGAIDSLRHWGLATAALPPGPPAPAPEPGYALVLDEPVGAARRNDLQELLVLAQEEHPGVRVLVLAGADGGQIRDADLGDRMSRIEGAPPLRDVLDGAVAVYTVAAPLGFDAIMAGHRPVVLGEPPWAGHGLTDDRGPVTRYRRPLTRAQLLAATMLCHATWYDPHRDRLCTLEEAIAAEAAMARADREDRAGYVAAGMRLWKRGHIARALGRTVRFAGTPAKGAALARRLSRPLVVWGAAEGVPVDQPVLRAEDGFLRSRGLGARLVPPLSLALDDLGIYFDPRSESRLERLIASSPSLPVAEIRRAEALIASLRRAGLSKYNIGGDPDPDLPEHAILVAGQVEDDASILWGAGEVRTNLALLEAARAANPDARIVYKPHPDVEAGLRRGGVPESQALALADAIVTEADPAALLTRVASVWTMTSLLGFEALLRGLPVTCLGAPFYAGWGLTRDLGAVPARRTARPTLAGLAHAALIAYPRYRDPETGLPCPPEVVVDRLASGVTPDAGGLLARLQGLRATLLAR